MNDPNKVINVNLSSLLSLKAELLRKQNEVKDAKAAKSNADDLFDRTNISTTRGESRKEKKKKSYSYTEKPVSCNNDAKVYETEDYALLEKSRRVLQAKSKYYERMSRNGGSLNSDDNCLVMFNRKRQEEDNEHVQGTATLKARSSSDSELSDSETDEQQTYPRTAESNEQVGVDSDDEDDFVEFTDCLGRTRKCLRKDLADARRRDNELAESMPDRLDQTKANWMIDTNPTRDAHNSDDDDNDKGTCRSKRTESIYSEGLSTMSKLEEQRVNWELKEQENFDKPDVHYQDVFFDEARMHGVGYYAFSTDEDERKKQQKELEETRKATIAEQKNRNDIKAERDSLVTDRVFAAKNRILARNGLPPMTREEFDRERNKPKEHELVAKKLERKERKRVEKLAREKALAETDNAQLRQEHVRPWDLEKLGKSSSVEDDEPVQPWEYKSERLPMSQAEWNEQQRAVRKPEFAPMLESEVIPKRINFTSMPPPPPPQHMSMSDYYNTSTNEFSQYQSTKRENKFQRRSYMQEEAADNEDVEPKRAAIPPPANLENDYSLPPHAKRPKSNDELARSIDAGLRFLREQSDKSQTGGKTSWSSKADY